MSTGRVVGARAVWQQFRQNRQAMIGFVILVALVLMALAAPLIVDESELNAINAVDNPRWDPPSAEFWFGTDHLGRSVFAQFVWGARVSLFVGLVATVLTVLIGTLVGLGAGYLGGWTEAGLMRVTDWFFVIPFLPLAIVLASVLERSLWTIILVIGITTWPTTARVVRAQTLTVKQRTYVERARALGGSDTYLVGRHILPNVAPLILATLTLTVPIAILTETTLAFLGLGDPTRASWGKTLEEAYSAGALGRQAWWYYLPAGLGILLVVLAFTMCGRALEEILDPRLR